MRAGIDIRVDAHRDPRGASHFHRKLREQVELRLGLDIDAEDVGGERGAQLGLGLADAGEQDLARRDAGRLLPLGAVGDASVP